MVEPGVGDEAIQALAGTGLGIGRAVDEPPEPALDDRAGAHRAGLERDVEHAVVEPPRPDRLAGPGQRQPLGVGRRIVERFPQVEALGEDPAGRARPRRRPEPRRSSAPPAPARVLATSSIRRRRRRPWQDRHAAVDLRNRHLYRDLRRASRFQRADSGSASRAAGKRRAIHGVRDVPAANDACHRSPSPSSFRTCLHPCRGH